MTVYPWHLSEGPLITCLPVLKKKGTGQKMKTPQGSPEIRNPG